MRLMTVNISARRADAGTPFAFWETAQRQAIRTATFGTPTPSLYEHKGFARVFRAHLARLAKTSLPSLNLSNSEISNIRVCRNLICPHNEKQKGSAGFWLVHDGLLSDYAKCILP